MTLEHKKHVDAFEYWVKTNTENGVCTIPEYICKGIVGMLGKQPVAIDTNVGDKISRQAAIDAVNNAFDRETLLTGFVRSIAVRAIRNMPSAQPERKTGRWVSQKGGGYCCSECGRYALDEVDGNFIHVAFESNFCPYCGAKMERRTDGA